MGQTPRVAIEKGHVLTLLPFSETQLLSLITLIITLNIFSKCFPLQRAFMFIILILRTTLGHRQEKKYPPILQMET